MHLSPCLIPRLWMNLRQKKIPDCRCYRTPLTHWPVKRRASALLRQKCLPADRQPSHTLQPESPDTPDISSAPSRGRHRPSPQQTYSIIGEFLIRSRTHRPHCPADEDRIPLSHHNCTPAIRLACTTRQYHAGRAKKKGAVLFRTAPFLSERKMALGFSPADGEH